MMDFRCCFYYLGLDIGSTTVKAVLMNESGQTIWSRYCRHLSESRQTLIDLLTQLDHDYPNIRTAVAITGSGGIGVSRVLKLPFVQEVIAATESIRQLIPETDVAIELGGEDAKITFFDHGIDQRMNETCAGGTGAFIDQMAAYLQTDPAGLNALAKNHKMLYPIASRCGVFAKTDIMPLLNEGAAKEDIAASIFQAVVDQTVSGLACGRKIEGNIAFLGGPLFFLSSLRERFIDSLKLPPKQVIFPSDNAHYFVAMGAAFYAKRYEPVVLKDIVDHAAENLLHQNKETVSLAKLFETNDDYLAFKKRHDQLATPRVPLDTFTGKAYLGIDSGSTTIKAVLIDEFGDLLYTSYQSNQGNPLAGAIEILKDIYKKLPSPVILAGVGVTGYGGALLKAALQADLEEVETVAHFKGVQFYLPDVSFILDIGGQDMKCLHIHRGVIERIMLNEACSAGCGSFIQAFASSVDTPLEAFVKAANEADHPVDLGSRCTVFMNSKVKQAQKEGATIGDIAAGLSYSVVRNALYKVIKINSLEELGEKIAVQGGAFLNDALLRAFETLVGKQVYRPDIAGLMGAFGVARLTVEHIQKNAIKTNVLSLEALENFTLKTQVARCGLCGNRCLLTINRFGNGQRHISGNRCEKGAGIKVTGPGYPNLYAHKYDRLFNYYEPLSVEEAPMGVIGIPRALGMFEQYPFWYTLFTQLGFRVELSAPSSKAIFNLGMDSIPSQTVCYPAKLAHGHIMDLIGRGITTIFFPSVLKEYTNLAADDHYNCPVVFGYPELLSLNIDELKPIQFLTPYLPFDDDKRLITRLLEELASFNLSKKQLTNAVMAARCEQLKFKAEIQAEGDRVLQWLEDNNELGIVLAGHPYHVDPEVHHGLPELIVANGVAVLTEDSVLHRQKDIADLRVVDQWTYHSRIYRAATLVSKRKNLELVQCTSFGCGLDAVITDQAKEIMERHHKIYTLLKIDEGENLGAARIRIRSLLAAVRDQRGSEEHQKAKEQPIMFHRPKRFEKKMKKTHTILIPQMSPIHFQFMAKVFEPAGYRVEVLPEVCRDGIETGLRYVNNDACYPALVVIGQLINAIKKGHYDPDKVALMMSQTGGACRASNYIGMLKKALQEAGYPDIPIISIAPNVREPSPGFKLTTPMMRRLLVGALYGDILNRLSCRTRPYEQEKGITDKLVAKWSQRCIDSTAKPSSRDFRDILKEMAQDFASVPIIDKPKPRVGLVGEILLKYHPDANNHAVKLIEAEGGEAVVTDLIDFFLYCASDYIYRHEKLSGGWLSAQLSKFIIWFIERQRNVVREALKPFTRFQAPIHIRDMAKLGESIVSLGFQAGEGWLLAAEMVEFLEHKVPNILCMQPFGCLPNHISGKGVIKALKQRYPYANIAAVDYDPGASEVNQLNRIKLMMSVAHHNLESMAE